MTEKMARFRVFTVGEPEGFIFEGEDARRMHREFNRVGMVRAEWATVQLVNGKQITFIVRNVTSFSYEEGESK